jgi:hypothetical protein
MSTISPPWKVALIGSVAVVAGTALFLVDWTLAQLAAFVAMLFVARGALHLVTMTFDGVIGALFVPPRQRPRLAASPAARRIRNIDHKDRHSSYGRAFGVSRDGFRQVHRGTTVDHLRSDLLGQLLLADLAGKVRWGDASNTTPAVRLSFRWWCDG